MQIATQQRPALQRHHGPRIADVERLVRRFLVPDTATAAAWMINLRAYGMKIAFTTSSEGHVDWIDEETILYQHLEFTMSELRIFVRTLLDQTTLFLDEKLLFGDILTPPLRTIPWSLLRDNPVEKAPF